MCWNQYISLNTFTFGIFVLLLIAFNNKYSQYKLEEFQNPYTYFFVMSFLLMQLVEFVLWRNLNDDFINKWASILGCLLIAIQPIASLSMLKNTSLRNKLMTIYSIPSLIYFIYNLSQNNINTTVSKSGHLVWNWVISKNNFIIPGYIFYLFFLYFTLFYNKLYVIIMTTLPLFFIIFYFYYRDGSSGSIWCWSVNITLLFYLIKLLIYLPYKEKGFLC